MSRTKNARNVTASERKQMQKLRLDGMILERIAKRLGRSTYCVYINTLGIDHKNRHNKVAAINRRTGKACWWALLAKALRRAA